MGNQHPSPNAKTLCHFEPKFWLEIITSRDAKMACFEGCKTSYVCNNFWHFSRHILAEKHRIAWWMRLLIKIRTRIISRRFYSKACLNPPKVEVFFTYGSSFLHTDSHGCSFLAYSWKLPAYSGAFLLTIDNFSLVLTVGAFSFTILGRPIFIQCRYWGELRFIYEGVKTQPSTG